MAEPDSWEDVEEGGGGGGGGASRRSAHTTTSVAAAAGAAKLNADAPAFTFNPSAASFTPFVPALVPGHVPAPAAVVHHPVGAGPPPKPHFHDVNAGEDLHSAHQTPFTSGASALPALAGRNTEPPQETDVASELVVDSSQAPETRDLDVDLKKEDAAEEQIPPPAAEEKDAAAPSNGSVESKPLRPLFYVETLVSVGVKLVRNKGISKRTAFIFFADSSSDDDCVMWTLF